MASSLLIFQACYTRHGMAWKSLVSLSSSHLRPCLLNVQTLAYHKTTIIYICMARNGRGCLRACTQSRAAAATTTMMLPTHSIIPGPPMFSTLDYYTTSLARNYSNITSRVWHYCTSRYCYNSARYLASGLCFTIMFTCCSYSAVFCL